MSSRAFLHSLPKGERTDSFHASPGKGSFEVVTGADLRCVISRGRTEKTAQRNSLRIHHLKRPAQRTQGATIQSTNAFITMQRFVLSGPYVDRPGGAQGEGPRPVFLSGGPCRPAPDATHATQKRKRPLSAALRAARRRGLLPTERMRKGPHDAIDPKPGSIGCAGRYASFRRGASHGASTFTSANSGASAAMRRRAIST